MNEFIFIAEAQPIFAFWSKDSASREKHKISPFIFKV